jgi:hypothetical protein
LADGAAPSAEPLQPLSGSISLEHGSRMILKFRECDSVQPEIVNELERSSRALRGLLG